MYVQRNDEWDFLSGEEEVCVNCTDVAFWTVLFVYFFSGDPVAGHGGKKSRFGRVLLTSVGNIFCSEIIFVQIFVYRAIHTSLNDFQT